MRLIDTEKRSHLTISPSAYVNLGIVIRLFWIYKYFVAKRHPNKPKDVHTRCANKHYLKT